MIKAILVLFSKLPLALKGLLSIFITFLETIVRFIDDIGFHVLQPIRAIRFPDVREFLSENIVTIFLFIILLIIIYLNFKNREEKV
tara:strand:- start:854 stop:1111 length:258 start_codon:yes stop_codon:yes gene_type:complete